MPLWATIIGNAGSVIYYLFIYFKTQTSLSLLPRDFKPSIRIFSEVLKIGVPSAASSVLMSIASILMQNITSGYQPFAGYNYGAKNYRRMLSALKFVAISSTCICIVFLFPFIFFARAFMSIFTPEEEIIGIGVQFLHAYAICLPVLGIQISLMCTFQAAGAAVRALIVNLGRQCIFNMPLIVILNAVWQFKGLTYAGPIADIFTAILAALLGIPLLRQIGSESKENIIQQEKLEV